MFLSKAKNGIYYLFFFDARSKRRAISTRCRLKSEALEFLQSFKREEHEQKSRLSRIVLSAFSSEYLEHSRSIHTPKSVRANQVALSEFLRISGDLPLAKVGIREVERFLAQKTVEASPWTARKYHIALAAAFECALRWGYIVSNPFRAVSKPRLPEIQPSFFTKEDFQRLLSAVEDQDFRDLFITAVSTGMRLGELLALRWDALDFEKRLIHVRNTETFVTKSKRERVLPMNDGLHRVLQTRRERCSNKVPFVFQVNGHQISEGYVSHKLKMAVRKAGLSDRLHFHSLRHSHASWLVQEGVSLYEVQKLLGHSSISVSERYSHLLPDTLHESVNKIQLEFI